MLKEFKKFALRGNLVDLAVGFTVGVAFAAVAQSLVKDILMPPIGLLLGGADFADLFVVLRDGEAAAPPYATLADAQTAGAVTLNYGAFFNNVLGLLVIAIAMFVVVRMYNKADERLEQRFAQEKKTPDEPDTKKCQFCLATIPYKAIRCPQCTSHLDPNPSEAA